ncbi:hypothetical protein [Streptacidiphilus jiangxiensis]|uniref:Uncharacterized protein n=1 Tax=Streptacidiphilus jiangxiensis TaxID=235985 RepID=A0A1H7RIL9_STRJI|nr:hypothetical protein [Streptacidiphilus jiangxiensis]SEL59945.1 hypothetical protein SAMN05414137_110150 [Streptacidiphilus jiangxiensis]
MAKRRRAIAGVLASAALLAVWCTGPALASDAAPGGGTTLVTVGGAPASGAAGSAAADRAKAQPPVVLATMTVDPAQSRAGAAVDLRTFADCGGTSTGEVRSAAFAAPVGLALAEDGGLYAAARIAPDVKPGSYLVHEFCAGHPVAAGRLTIADLGAPATGGGWRALRVRPTPAKAPAPTAASSLPRDAAIGLTLASLACVGAFSLHRRYRLAPVDADA